MYKDSLILLFSFRYFNTDVTLSSSLRIGCLAFILVILLIIIRMCIMRLLIRSTETAFSTSASFTSTPTPPSPDSSPLHRNLYLESLPVIIRAEQPFQRDFCIAHKEIFLRDMVSTISLALPLIVPTLSDPIRKLLKDFVLFIIGYQGLCDYAREQNRVSKSTRKLIKNCGNLCLVNLTVH